MYCLLWFIIVIVNPPPLIWYSWVFFWHDWVVSVSFTMSLITFTAIITIFINIYINNIVKWKECSSIPICTLSWMTLLFSVTLICNHYSFYYFFLISKLLLYLNKYFNLSLIGAGKRKRIQIRFIVELFQVGICLDDEFFCQLLRALVGKIKG